MISQWAAATSLGVVASGRPAPTSAASATGPPLPLRPLPTLASFGGRTASLLAPTALGFAPAALPGFGATAGFAALCRTAQ